MVRAAQKKGETMKKIVLMFLFVLLSFSSSSAAKGLFKNNIDFSFHFWHDAGHGKNRPNAHSTSIYMAPS